MDLSYLFTRGPDPYSFSPDPDRYEIRKLGPEHEDAVLAIVAHAMTFHSPFWTPMYPYNQAKRAYDLFDACRPAVYHHIRGGHSYGVFDKHYISPYADPEPNSVRWDHKNLLATEHDLLTAMDAPLVSVALFNHASTRIPDDAMRRLLDEFPELAILNDALAAAEAGITPPEAELARALGDLLELGPVCTRADYAGRGLATALARWAMALFESLEYRVIVMLSTHPTMTRIWSRPQLPYHALVTARLDTAVYRLPKKGLLRYDTAFWPSRVVCSKIYTLLFQDWAYDEEDLRQLGLVPGSLTWP